MDLLKQIFFDCFTGKTNDIFDIGRILWALSVIVFLGLAIYDVVLTRDFNPEQFGIGLSLVLAGGGAALGFKRSTEKEN